MKAPCKDCPERAPHCHGACERYQAYKQAKEEENARRRAEMAAAEASIQGVERALRKNRQKGR